MRPCAHAQVGVLTTVYTVYGGLVVSIYTDQIQARWLACTCCTPLLGNSACPPACVAAALGAARYFPGGRQLQQGEAGQQQ